MGMAGALLTMMLISLFIGRYNLDAGQILQVLQSRITGNGYPDLEVAEYVLWQVRLPRILMAVLVGAGLAVAGASLQGLFQNPLVSPDILGVCSGSGFGAALGILLTSAIGFFTAGLSFIFGLISIGLTLSMVRLKGQAQTLSYILSGIVVTSVFSALTSLRICGGYQRPAPAITFWLMGSFANTDFRDLKSYSYPF